MRCSPCVAIRPCQAQPPTPDILKTITYPNGDKFEGKVGANGKANGRGTLTTSDGRVYKGKFKDDKLNGRGTMNCVDGSRYDGTQSDTATPELLARVPL